MSRLLDFFKGILSLVLILVLLIGVPVALIQLVGFPFPTAVPSFARMRAHITDGDIPDVFVIKALALVVWAVWIQLAVAVVIETLALLRGRVSGRVPVLPGLQSFAGHLVASTLLIMSAFTPGRSVAVAPIVPISEIDAGPSAQTVAALGLNGSVGAETDAASGRAHQARTADGAAVGGAARNGMAQAVDGSDATPGDPVRAPKAVGQYATKPGDNWWDMAERLLGDGMRWSELRDLNAGRTMLTGEVITAQTEEVRSGWSLDVPADADRALLETAVAIDQIDEPSLTAEDPVISAPLHAVRHEQPVHAETETEIEAPFAGDPEDVAESESESHSESESDSDAAGESPERLQRPYTLVYEGPTGAVDTGPGVPYQVVEGDNLWDIADRHLGDPLRWPEIFERSRDLQQSFGRTISDPNLIWPDSILWLPTGATGVPQADMELVSDVVGSLESPEVEAESDAAVEGIEADDNVDEGESAAVAVMPDDLRRATAAAGAAAESMAESDPVTAEPPVAGPPDVESSDAESPLAEPSDVAPDPPTQSPVAPPPPSMPPPSPTPDPPVDGPSSEQPADGTAAVGFGAGGLLVASGLLGLLRRARRLRLSEAGERSRPAQPPVELVDIETILRNDADGGLASSVHRAIGSLANRSVVVGEPLASPEVIRVSGGQVEVVLDRPDPELPAPWVSVDAEPPPSLAGRWVARLPSEAFPATEPVGLDESADRWAASIAPTCVTVGRGLMLNLETLGVIAISGSVEAAAGLVRSMVHELATGPGRRMVDVRVSDWLPGADLHTHVRCAPLDRLEQELRRWFEDVELGLASAGGFSAYAMRVGGEGQPLPTPMVVFADAADAPHLQEVAAQAARHELPLAMVFSGDLSESGIEPAVIIDIDGATTTVQPHGFVAATQYVGEELLIGTEALIAHARQAAMVLRSEAVDPLDAASDFETDEANVPTEETPEHEIVTEQPENGAPEITDQATNGDGGILIRVLGPLSVDGGPRRLNEEELSLLAFLSLVGPSTADQIKDAVWPDGGIDDERFDELVQGLRGALQHRFPDAADGRFRVRSVVTDLGQARRWISQAAALSPDRGRNMLELALGDVRGEPFSGVTERWWQWTADHKMAIATQASTLLMDACFDLCDSAYQANDLHLARWACDVGARIDPLHETVAIRRVQLMLLGGAVAEATAVVEEWEALYAHVAERPPPGGPRAALSQPRSTSAGAAVPHVG